MRTAFVASYLANVILNLATLAVLPARVAIHFGARGLPDNWATRETNAVLMLGLHTLVFVMLYLTPRLVLALPPRWVNLPHKDYWLREENRATTLAQVAAYLWQFGTALFLFMFVVGVLAVLANLSEPVRLHLPVFLTALGAFLVYTLWWCFRFYRAFRLPAAPMSTGPGGLGATRPRHNEERHADG